MYLRQAFSLAKNILKNTKFDLVTTQDPFETALVGLNHNLKVSAGKLDFKFIVVLFHIVSGFKIKLFTINVSY